MSNEYQDEHLACSWKLEDGSTCGTPFTWTARDQEFYAEKGYKKPKYCRPHREERKKQQQGPYGEALRKTRSEAHKGDREEFGV